MPASANDVRYQYRSTVGGVRTKSTNVTTLSSASPTKHNPAQSRSGARPLRQPRSSRIAQRMLVTPHRAYTVSAIALAPPQNEGIGERAGRAGPHALDRVLAHQLDDGNRLLRVSPGERTHGAV